MIIRRGNSEEMLKLWNGRFEDFVEKTVGRVNAGEQEPWMMWDEETGEAIGELHIRWTHEDPDCANGVDTAYLEAFRMDERYQGRHLGTALMKRCLERIQERGFTAAVIGADDYDPKLGVMYQKWGFTERIKEDSFTYQYNGQEVLCTFVLYRNSKL